jgi:5-methylcytosine-specific restriction endonuclease McrBC GTP-binding regulatory subunit McrB
MIAVHDQRISNQEKTSGEIQVVVEKRREEFDVKLKDVYETMRDQDNNILSEILKLRQESSEQHKTLSNKINQLERYIWMGIGGGMVITWVLSNAVHYLKFVQ